ncbi:ExcA [Escherichia coli]|uniref:ExcA n=1 Tax=Escherichia coli TaxID=562 RepID=UPI001401A3E5|nr:ExcA [Escherichia coli]EBR8810347.1 ExcA [Salmonella enterica subsp. enterica serovar Java]MCW3263120.1 ExcA [Escherichia coli]HBP7866653.1 ExcA [Escherichia coli]HCL8057934.1 ExcA [Escherichia coli]HEK8475547.1 ExcA [Escherichia coli]
MNALSNTDFKKISNNARPKRLGYYASWLWMMFVFLFLFVSAFVFLSGLYWTIRDGSIQEHWFSTVGIFVIDSVLIWMLKKDFRSRKLYQVTASMKNSGFFEPHKDCEHYDLARRTYIGFDFSTGIIGVATLYATSSIKRERLFFEAETVESWESVGRELIINLRNTGLTTITITAPNINKAYRDMEIICRTHKNRDENYQHLKSKLTDAGWFINSNY